MHKASDARRNTVLYASKEALFTAGYPMAAGAFMQLFLANKGMSTASIGLVSTIISIILTVTSMLLSNVAENKPNPLKQSNRLIFAFSIGFLLFIPTALLDIDRRYLTLIVTVLASGLTILYAVKSILEYKIPYQIVDTEYFGTLTSFTSALVGAVGIVSSFVFSQIISRNALGNPYLVCMILAAVLFFLAWVLSRNLRITNHSFDAPARKKASAKEIWQVLSSRDFRIFIIPNALRGITLGITGSLTLIVLAMGISEADASKLTIVMSVAQVAASLLCFFLIRKISVDTIGLVGSFLVCAVVFLPANNIPLLLALVLVAIIGRVLVDNCVPIMCYHIIDPSTAGTYHAWRCILNNLISTGTVFLTGILVEKVDPLFLLIPCALSYVICMIWYMIFYRKICREKNIQISRR